MVFLCLVGEAPGVCLGPSWWELKEPGSRADSPSPPLVGVTLPSSSRRAGGSAQGLSESPASSGERD